MNKVILVAHGKLADEMKNSAEMIFGQLSNFYPIDFLKEEGLESIQKKIENVMVDETQQYLILTDLFCGTPYNASCAVAMKRENQCIHILSGMSLPLVLEAASMIEGTEIKQIAKHLTSIAGETVRSFKEQIIVEEEEF